MAQIVLKILKKVVDTRNKVLYNVATAKENTAAKKGRHTVELRLAKMGHMECRSMYRKGIPADTTYSHMEQIPEWHRVVPLMACMAFLALMAFGMALMAALLP